VDASAARGFDGGAEAGGGVDAEQSHRGQRQEVALVGRGGRQRPTQQSGDGGGERAEAAGRCGDGVVAAEPGDQRIRVSCGGDEHGLLDGGERAGFDDLGG
jgi:hypothetical protein